MGDGSADGLLRVVLADDDESLRRLLRLNLELGGGVEVVGEAGDGDGAVDAAVRFEPDVLVLDIDLPGRDGLQVVRTVREQVPSVHVVVFSGWPSEGYRTQLLEAGAARYVVKTDVREIVRAVREVGGAGS